MSYELYIAKRYIRSKKEAGFISFITYIAIVGIMLGVAALIITLTILAGFEREIKEKVVGFTSQVQVIGFENQKLPNYQAAMERIQRNIAQVKSIAPFVLKEAIVRTRDATEGVLVKGVDPLNDVTTVRTHVEAGAYDLQDNTSIPKILIGNKLARKLAVHVGERVTIFAISGRMNSLGPPRVKQFQVSGIYETGMSEYDDIYVYTSLEIAQNLFQLGDAASGFDILLLDINQAQIVADKIQDMLGYPYYARTIFQLYRNLFTWIELQKKPTPVILGLIIIVATVNIIGTLLMVVMEKTNQIGILKSMGASSASIANIFIIEGLFIGIVGTILGNILAFGLCWIQLQYKVMSLPSQIYFMSSVPILLRTENFVLVSTVSLLLCFLATIIPSRLASRLTSIVAIRFG